MRTRSPGKEQCVQRGSYWRGRGMVGKLTRLWERWGVWHKGACKAGGSGLDHLDDPESFGPSPWYVQRQPLRTSSLNSECSLGLGLALANRRMLCQF